MAKESKTAITMRALEQGGGILRLAPTWVPRAFLAPGMRIKLAPQDTYATGANRGGIDERWFGSTIAADNGPGTPPDEGLSYIVSGKDRVLLRDAIEASGDAILGKAMMKKWGGWKVYAKFFDNMGPIPHHLHQMERHAKKVGREGKPESYYFPSQLNATGNNFPYTFFGLNPGVTKDQVRGCLERWNQGDNGILDLSRAFRLTPGTGWLLPGGILHAPGSFVTYEVQWGSDVFAMFQSMVEGRYVPWDLMVKDVPRDKHKDLDYLIEMIDWEVNTDPDFHDHHYLEPVPVRQSSGPGVKENWVIYGKVDGQDLFSAKELTVSAGRRATVKEKGPYCGVVLQGHGMVGKLTVESPSMVRYGEMTEDEFFVTDGAARNGVLVENTGREPLVILKYLGPDSSPDAPEVGAHRKKGK